MSQPLKMVIFGTFLTTQISELRNNSVNPILPAGRVTLELNVRKVFLTPTFRKWLFCAILCHYPTLSFQNLDEHEKGL